MTDNQIDSRFGGHASRALGSRVIRHSLLVSALLLVSGYQAALSVSPAEPESTAPSSGRSVPTPTLDREIAVLENRFFFHQYGHDPLEKRLERLELLILGEARSGLASARLDVLKAMIRERDAQGVRFMRESRKTAPHSSEGSSQSSDRALSPGEINDSSASGSASGAGRSKDNDSSLAKERDGGVNAVRRKSESMTSYPMVGTLEWRVLKKTYPGDSLDQRLNRLEEHIFGASAQAMSYLDRVERLRKTTGIGVSQTPSDTGVTAPGGRLKYGPLPKAGMNNFSSPFVEPNSGKIEGVGPENQPQSKVPSPDSLFRTFRDGNGNGFSFYYSAPGSSFGPQLPLDPLGVSEIAPDKLPGFSFDDESGNSGSRNFQLAPRSLPDLMGDLNRRMLEMMRRFNGVEALPFSISPDDATNLHRRESAPNQNADADKLPSRGGTSKGNSPRGSSPVQILPQRNASPVEQLPPYSDPNSI
ncbi:MAG: hypothetical protein K2Y32_11150 [Candidatus Obscuribacterales bacterium]|nr:hypothetical protein [Candidatus Obscuribacterales bacterium]